MESTKNGKPWAIWIALGCSVLALVWLTVVFLSLESGQRCNPPKYYSNSQDTYVYSELLAQQNTTFLKPANPYLNLIVLIAFLWVSGVLYSSSNRPRIIVGFIILALALPGIACYLSTISCAFSDYTDFDHLGTIKFDNHVYQLAFASELASGADVYLEYLFVYECDLTGEICHLSDQRIVPYDVKDANLARFEINSDNQLLVVVRDETILTIDADSVETSN